MIIGFSVENFRSYKGVTEVSFVSSPRRDEPAYRLPLEGTRHGVLPVLGVWGANASGKSNLLLALREFHNMVKWSFTGLQPDAPVPWTPWRLDRESAPTRMSLEFTVPDEDGSPVRHHLAVEWTAEGIVYEALHAWPKGRARRIYERDADGDPVFRPGRGLHRARDVWQATRPNSLFLSAAAQLNHAQLGSVFRAITEDISFARPEPQPGTDLLVFDPSSPLVQARHRERILAFLKAADLAVRDVHLREREDVKKAIVETFGKGPDDTPAWVKQITSAPPPVEMRLVHGAGEDSAWECPSEYESDGTRKLLTMLETLFPVLERGGLWVVDELDRSLHPDLCREIIGIFTDPDANAHGAQLLFATHSRELLDELRTDEVLLVDRDEDGASTLHSAADYRELRTRDQTSRAHRQGRIGAVPVLLGLGSVLAAAWIASATSDKG